MTDTRRGWATLARVLLVLVTILAVFVVVIRFAPFYLPQVDADVPYPEQGEHRVFGYATLTSPMVRLVVTGRHVPAEPAEIEGFLRAGRDLVPAEGSVIEGRVFVVSASELRRLDRYEQLGSRYGRAMLELVDGSEAWVYRKRD